MDHLLVTLLSVGLGFRVLGFRVITSFNLALIMACFEAYLPQL